MEAEGGGWRVEGGGWRWMEGKAFPGERIKTFINEFYKPHLSFHAIPIENCSTTRVSQCQVCSIHGQSFIVFTGNQYICENHRPQAWLSVQHVIFSFCFVACDHVNGLLGLLHFATV